MAAGTEGSAIPGEAAGSGPETAFTPLAAPSPWRHLPLAVLVSAYVFWFCLLSLKMYNGYGYPPFDLAIFDQGLWLLSHLHAPFVTVMGRNLFGDHTSFILLLIVPFYRLVPEPQGILVLQVCVLGGTAIPLYALAQKLTHSTTIATLLAASYLLNPALQNGDMEQFHPEALQVLIIALAIYAALEWKPVLLGTMVVLALLVKEDAALLVVPLGLWVLWRRNRLFGLSIVIGAILWAGIANEVIIPVILGVNYYANRIPFGGWHGFLDTLARTPGQVWSYLGAGGRPFYFWQMGFSVGWGFVVSPELAAIGVLVLAENIVSNDPYMHQIIYHYSMPLVPVLAIGTITAIAAQKSRIRRNILAVLVAACALWSCALWGLAPFSRDSFYPAGSNVPGSTIRAATYLEIRLPPNAVVSAWYPFVSHIDHRSQVYVWPTPFAAINWGLGTNNGAPLPFARQVQYLMLPLVLAPGNNRAVFESISKRYELVASLDGMGLYERTG
jgi:uncharacterized membrane protein